MARKKMQKEQLAVLHSLEECLNQCKEEPAQTSVVDRLQSLLVQEIWPPTVTLTSMSLWKQTTLV
jgi:hypothetical protein